MDDKKLNTEKQEAPEYKDEFIMRKAFKKPYVLIPFGIILLIPAIYSIFFSFTVNSALLYIPISLLGLGMLLGGILRIVKK